MHIGMYIKGSGYPRLPHSSWASPGWPHTLTLRLQMALLIFRRRSTLRIPCSEIGSSKHYTALSKSIVAASYFLYQGLNGSLQGAL